MKEEKALVIDTIREWVKSSPYLIVLDYTGMKVAEFSELRGRLRKVGAAVKVVKNTLFKRAIGEEVLAGLGKDLTGQTAIVSGGKDAPASDFSAGFDLGPPFGGTWSSFGSRHEEQSGGSPGSGCVICR